MAEGGVAIENGSDKKLNDMFVEGWDLYDELDGTELPFISKAYQDKVKVAISNFENATRTVSQICMFSINEILDEVSTESLQYLLLPFFLGKLVLKINQENRLELLNIAEVYFKDFLKRCEEYEVIEKTTAANNTAELPKETLSNDEMAKLMRAAHARNQKIQQYRRKKELDNEINAMKLIIRKKDVDEEQKREFFLKLIKRSIIEAKEELESVNDEKKLVEMQRMRLAAGEEFGIDFSAAQPTNRPHTHGHSHAPHGHQKQGVPENKPLQPFIITRDATQKAVFGAGYPSLPVMSVDEFYTQRVQDGIFPDEAKTAQMNKAQAVAAAKDPNDKEDEEKAQMEEQIDRDDPDYIERMRRMDEYKDVVRRGDGNRYNRS